MLFSVNIYIWFHVWYLYVQGFVLTYVPNIFFIITKIGLMLYNVLQDHARLPLINLQWEKSPCGEGFLMDAIMIHFHLYES